MRWMNSFDGRLRPWRNSLDLPLIPAVIPGLFSDALDPGAVHEAGMWRGRVFVVNFSMAQDIVANCSSTDMTSGIKTCMVIVGAKVFDSKYAGAHDVFGSVKRIPDCELMLESTSERCIGSSSSSPQSNIFTRNWSEGITFSKWIGIYCSNDRRVATLNLSNMGLKGTIGSWLLQLPY
ncbi:hypothetical protein RJ640_023728 [Escallonia rubra]|uniref:Uncharacterized protein n=1 Tax=Escallonia rubra TaxID=112253 RepID=A0AA88R128_9ASTE|nr:hypothetical protein RJ640_023728 [Escallonia rubra]